jgi:hypothetical protein
LFPPQAALPLTTCPLPAFWVRLPFPAVAQLIGALANLMDMNGQIKRMQQKVPKIDFICYARTESGCTVSTSPSPHPHPAAAA